MEDERNDRKDQKDVYQGTRYVKHHKPAYPCQQEQEKQDHVDTHAFPPLEPQPWWPQRGKTPIRQLPYYCRWIIAASARGVSRQAASTSEEAETNRSFVDKPGPLVLRYFGILFGAFGVQAVDIAIPVDRPTVFIGARFTS
jgi:hypothetical protein